MTALMSGSPRSRIRASTTRWAFALSSSDFILHAMGLILFSPASTGGGTKLALPATAPAY